MMKLLPPRVGSLAKNARDFGKRTIDSSQWLMSFSQGPQVLEDAIAFQDPIDEICAERPHHLMRGFHLVIMGMFLVSLLTAALVKVDKVVVGTGRVTTANPPVMLQPLDRGIIRELKVKAGDVVHKGEILATLDPTFARADLATLSTQQRLLVAQVTRLEAELADVPYTLGPNALPEEQLQLSLYGQRRSQYEAQLRVFDESIDQRKANMRTTEIDRSSQAQQLELAKQIETMRGAMLEKQIGSKLNYVEAQAARVRIEQAYNDATNRLVARSLCEMFGCTTVCVEDGESAVRIAATEPFDVILMDIKMPGMDGVEATGRIRSGVGPSAQTPIVALTANADPADAAFYRSRGMNGVVEKPIRPERLLAAMNAVVNAVAVAEPEAQPAAA